MSKRPAVCRWHLSPGFRTAWAHCETVGTPGRYNHLSWRSHLGTQYEVFVCLRTTASFPDHHFLSNSESFSARACCAKGMCPTILRTALRRSFIPEDDVVAIFVIRSVIFTTE